MDTKIDLDNSITSVANNISQLGSALTTLLDAFTASKAQVAALQAQVTTLQAGVDYTPEVTGLVNINTAVTGGIAAIASALA